jgi:hypothetical protein
MTEGCSKHMKADCEGSCKWVKGNGCKGNKMINKSKIFSTMSAVGVPNIDIMSAISVIDSKPEIVEVIDKQVSNFVQAQKKEFKLKPAVLLGIKTLVGVSIIAATAYAFHNKAFDPTVFTDVYNSTALAILPKVLTAISSKDPKIQTSTALAVIPSGFVLVQEPTVGILTRALVGGMLTAINTLQILMGISANKKHKCAAQHKFGLWNHQKNECVRRNLRKKK